MIHIPTSFTLQQKQIAAVIQALCTGW